MKRILLDSSVLLDLFTDDPVWGDRSAKALARFTLDNELCINDVVYAEVSVGFARIEALRDALEGLDLAHVPIPREALFLAGKAFLGYRKRGGVRTQPLPDFFIGAHAAVSAMPLLTRDPGRVRAAFPTVRIVTP